MSVMRRLLGWRGVVLALLLFFGLTLSGCFSSGVPLCHKKGECFRKLPNGDLVEISANEVMYSQGPVENLKYMIKRPEGAALIGSGVLLGLGLREVTE